MDGTDPGGRHAERLYRSCDKYGSCPHNCFLAGTPILTARGLVPIELVREGDLVVARMPTGNDNAAQLVRALSRKVAEKYLEISVQGEVIRATTEHPFRVREAGGEVWRAARDLSKADRLITAMGQEIHIDSTKLVEKAVEIFNFEVANWHNYYVGTHSILVHNESVAVTVSWSGPDGSVIGAFNGGMEIGTSTVVSTGGLSATGGSMTATTSPMGGGATIGSATTGVNVGQTGSIMGIGGPLGEPGWVGAAELTTGALGPGELGLETTWGDGPSDPPGSGGEGLEALF